MIIKYKKRHILCTKCAFDKIQFTVSIGNNVYSVLRATTGSFFAALLEGIIPAKRVNNTLIPINISAADKGKNTVKPLIPVFALINILIGMHKR